MKYLIGFLLTAVSFSSAFAQQQPSSPNEQALGQKVMQEIQLGLNCNAALITVQAELTKAQARLKELEPKEEPKESK